MADDIQTGLLKAILDKLNTISNQIGHENATGSATFYLHQLHINFVEMMRQQAQQQQLTKSLASAIMQMTMVLERRLDDLDFQDIRNALVTEYAQGEVPESG